jgi:hypothetical protein
MPGSTLSFSQTPRSNPISCATSAMAITLKFSVACHGLILLLFAHCSDRPQEIRGEPAWR